MFGGTIRTLRFQIHTQMQIRRIPRIRRNMDVTELYIVRS